MQALRKLGTGPGLVEVVDVPVPEPGAGQVLVQVKRAGICGTDLHMLHGGFSKVRPPVTLGHEFSGVVAGAGRDAAGWKPGDRVAIESEAFSCGQCPWCASGKTNLCPDRLAYGYSTDGGFAYYAAVRASGLHRLPEHVSFEEAALSEPLAVAVHAVIELAEAAAGERLLITGPGPIGLMTLQAAKSAGARVVVTGTQKDAARLEIAAKTGADHAVDSSSGGLAALIEDFTGGLGVDAALECSGTQAGLADCAALVKRGGRIVQVGLPGKPVQVDMDLLAFHEITLKGLFAHHHETWIKAVDLLTRRKVDLKPLVSGQFALKDWREAFRLSESGAGAKYLLCPSD